MKFLNSLKSIDKIFLLLLLFCGLILFVNLGTRGVERWDEYTNIQVVKESTGMNLSFQSEKFFEKPPIWYWLTRFLTNILGDEIWVYRLPSALSGSAIVALIYQFLKKRTNKTSAFISAVSFLLIPHNILVNTSDYFSTHTYKSADLDGLQILLIFLSFVLLQTKRKYWILSCILLGLGFLVKGPLVMIFLAINSLFIVSSRKFNRKELNTLFSGLITFGIIVLPWHLFMFINHGSDFTDVYLNYHIIERMNEGIEGHGHPVWYILKVFFDFRVNPLWPLLILALFNRKIYSVQYVRYSMIAIISVLLIFTIVETKLAWYVLPVYPFMCLVLGNFFYRFRFK
ncbi:MAG TPA: glycosyltransferase family 39 protein [Candidatus Dojkabacteria bacterium]|nr:glycosyltransferase family 39 protein [Candidatus Dojkabacteria bacterium]